MAAFLSMICIAADKSYEDMVRVYIFDHTGGIYFGKNICADSCKWLSGMIKKDIPDVSVEPWEYRCPSPLCKTVHTVVTFTSLENQKSLMNNLKKYGAMEMNPQYKEKTESLIFYSGLSELSNKEKYI